MIRTLRISNSFLPSPPTSVRKSPPKITRFSPVSTRVNHVNKCLFLAQCDIGASFHFHGNSEISGNELCSPRFLWKVMDLTTFCWFSFKLGNHHYFVGKFTDWMGTIMWKQLVTRPQCATCSAWARPADTRTSESCRRGQGKMRDFQPWFSDRGGRRWPKWHGNLWCTNEER